MSTLAVNTIQAETGTTVTVASGHSLDASAGIILPADVGGKILQVKQTILTTNTDFNNSTYTTLMSVTLTPASSSSKFLVMFTGIIDSIGDSYFRARFSKTVGGVTTETFNNWAYGALNFGSSNQHGGGYAMNHLDEPSTNSAITYNFDGMDPGNNATVRLNASGKSTLTVMEIAG
jgi:hypothetical protein